MNSTMTERRRPLPSIATVYRPIEEYWEQSRPVGSLDGGPTEALNPLDAFLVHRLLELVPGHPVLIDAANALTGGASSLIGMHHPRAVDVWAVVDAESLPSRRSLESLQRYSGRRGATPSSSFRPVDRSDLLDDLAGQAGAIVLADARGGDAAGLAVDIGRWLDARPDALVLVLGLGRVGNCPAVSSMMSLCLPGSGRRFRLLRELSEVLMGSSLGMVAGDDHPDVDVALMRLEQLYTGNYRYLDLLWRANHAALREARIDADVLRGHLTFGAISEEIEGLKCAVREANERAERAERATRANWTSSAPVEATASASPLTRLRRRLSPTPVGSAWRLAKHARVKLAPTPVGRAYRLSKRVALACVARGR